MAGYHTALIGKYLNGGPIGNWVTYIPVGWTGWYSPEEGDPFFAYDYELNENGEIVVYGTEPEDYLTDVLASFAVDFVKRSAKDNDPLFIYLAPYVPHGSAVPAPRYGSMFHKGFYPKAPSFNEEDVSDNRPIFKNWDVSIPAQSSGSMRSIAPSADLQFLEGLSEWLACVSMCSGENCWINKHVPPDIEML